MSRTEMTSQVAPHVLREYALLADGERGALIGPRGDIAWMCAPRWDSDGVFATLIGGIGAYAVTPVGRFVWGGHYEDGSLIWRSRWVTETGIIECREALAFPGDPHAAVILRRIIAVEGDAQLDVVLEPVAGFGRYHLRDLHRDSDGRWRGRVGDLRMRWAGADGAEVIDRGRGGGASPPGSPLPKAIITTWPLSSPKPTWTSRSTSTESGDAPRAPGRTPYRSSARQLPRAMPVTPTPSCAG